MLPASTSQGYGVRAFPDVCYTPAQPSPVPIPYPSIGAQSHIKGIKGRDATGKAVVRKSGVSTLPGTQAGAPGIISHVTKGKASFISYSGVVKVEGANVARLGVANNSPRVSQLRSRLQTITSQLVGMAGGNPDQWHQLVDEYVVVSAELYLEITPE